jgi:hypothetical protein
MNILHTYIQIPFSGSNFLPEQNPDGSNSHLITAMYAFICFADGGSPNKANKGEEIRDESGLGSGAGVTPGDQAAFNSRQSSSESETARAETADDAGATGPGSDREGDKMPGEDGITSVTDGIAKFIDDAEADNDSK